MEPPRYPPAPLPGIDFDVTFTDGAVERVTVTAQEFVGETPVYRVGRIGVGLSPERAATSWAWHRLMDRSIDGDHTAGIASIRRARVPPTPAQGGAP